MSFPPPSLSSAWSGKAPSTGLKATQRTSQVGQKYDLLPPRVYFCSTPDYFGNHKRLQGFPQRVPGTFATHQMLNVASTGFQGFMQQSSEKLRVSEKRTGYRRRQRVPKGPQKREYMEQGEGLEAYGGTSYPLKGSLDSLSQTRHGNPE